MITFDSLDDPKLIVSFSQKGVGVIPTDTIYGLAASAGSEESVARLYRLKQRESKPGTVIAASVDQLAELGLDEQALRAVAHLWPNPLSIVIPADPKLRYLDKGLGDLAVRVPAQADLREFLEKTGPLVTTRANHPGEPAANNIEEARAYFGDMVDFYVDVGDLSSRPPSTVARYSDGRLQVLRQGAYRVDGVGGS